MKSYLMQHQSRRGILRAIVLFLFLQPLLMGFQNPANKIQQAIDAIKKSLYSEDEDYHTDGQRTVWVKSYKRWTPDDLAVMKKEAPDVLAFLGKAVQHNRFDVLEQLLPDFYRTHNGVKAFAADIQRVQRNK